jgi:hypothetical protein
MWRKIVVVVVMLRVLLQALPPCACIAVDADYGAMFPTSNSQTLQRRHTRLQKHAQPKK